MGSYDSPGFHPPTFTGLTEAAANGRDGAMVGPGTDSASAQMEAPEASVVLGHPIISSPHASSQVREDMPTTLVTASQTQVPGQVPLREPFTGVDNTWRAAVLGDDPSSHVATPNHPNSAGLAR